MNTTLAFFAGVLVGAAAGVALCIMLYWIAKHYQEAENAHDDAEPIDIDIDI